MTSCQYPNCKCIVSTSTSQPEPICPKGLPKEEPPQKEDLRIYDDSGNEIL